MGRPVVYFEIGCRDRAKTARFFTDLFNWHVQDGPASTIDTGSTRGIPGHITSLGHEPHHYTMFYVEVDDVQAYLDKAAVLGGKCWFHRSKFRPAHLRGFPISMATPSDSSNRSTKPKE
ncbi:MAG: VOC family protein [Bryobacteraceae bacterium]